MTDSDITLPPRDSAAETDDRAIIDFLHDRDWPCPSCNYNLRQLRSAHCPECGERLRLTIGLTDQKIGAWVACLLACSFPAGVGTILLTMLLYNIRDVVRELRRGQIEWPFSLFMIYVIGMIPVVLALLIGRRRFLKLSVARQKFLAATSWLLLAIVLLVILSQIFRF